MEGRVALQARSSSLGFAVNQCNTQTERKTRVVLAECFGQGFWVSGVRKKKKLTVHGALGETEPDVFAAVGNVEDCAVYHAPSQDQHTADQGLETQAAELARADTGGQDDVFDRGPDLDHMIVHVRVRLCAGRRPVGPAVARVQHLAKRDEALGDFGEELALAGAAQHGDEDAGEQDVGDDLVGLQGRHHLGWYALATFAVAG